MKHESAVAKNPTAQMKGFDSSREKCVYALICSSPEKSRIEVRRAPKDENFKRSR